MRQMWISLAVMLMVTVGFCAVAGVYWGIALAGPMAVGPGWAFIWVLFELKGWIRVKNPLSITSADELRKEQ